MRIVRNAIGVGFIFLVGSVFAQSKNPMHESTWPAILEAARKEGSVVLYSQQVPPVLSRIQADFMAQYPFIKLETLRLAGQGVVSKLDQERLSGIDGGDVAISVEIPWMEDRAKEGNLRKPVGPSARTWPAKYMISDTFPIVGLEPLVMAYNTNLVKVPVTGYQDLLRPELKGRIGTTGVQAVTIVAWYEFLEKTQGADFLTKFAAQAPKVFTGAVPNTQSTASGEIAVTAFSVPTVVLPLAEKGAPIRMVIPNPALGFAYYAGAVSNSRRPNAAQVLMDYLMSPRGQAAWHSRGESASPLPNIQGSADANAILQMDPRPYSANSVNEYRKKWEAIFTTR